MQIPGAKPRVSTSARYRESAFLEKRTGSALLGPFFSIELGTNVCLKPICDDIVRLLRLHRAERKRLTNCLRSSTRTNLSQSSGKISCSETEDSLDRSRWPRTTLRSLQQTPSTDMNRHRLGHCPALPISPSRPPSPSNSRYALPVAGVLGSLEDCREVRLIHDFAG